MIAHLTAKPDPNGAVVEYLSKQITRTPAVVLFGHRAAVYMQAFNGYFDLDELSLDEHSAV